MTWLEDLTIWAMRLFRRTTRLVSWEPNSKNSFRSSTGFIDRNGVGQTKLGAEIVKARREMLFDRIMQTTHEMPVDQRLETLLGRIVADGDGGGFGHGCTLG